LFFNEKFLNFVINEIELCQPGAGSGGAAEARASPTVTAPLPRTDPAPLPNDALRCYSYFFQ